MSQAANLLSWARAVLTHPQLQVARVWPQAAALLARQGLEAGLDQFWSRQLPGMTRASRATQLACLEQYLRDTELVRGLRVAWASLTRACHHHPYELAPTAPELERWLDEVDGLIRRLDATGPED